MNNTNLLNKVPELVLETARTLSGGQLETVNSVANKIVSLIKDPDGLIGDKIYLR